MNAAGSPPAAVSVGDLLNLEVAARASPVDTKSGPLLFLAEIHKPQDASEKCRRRREIALPKSNGVQPANLSLHRYRAARPWSEHTLIGCLVKSDRQSVRIRERQRRGLPAHFHFPNGHSVLDQTPGPVVQTAERDSERHFHRKTTSRFRGGHLGPREKRYVGSRMPIAVGVKEVVRARRILVDALLHETHAEDAGIEIDVFLRIAGDAGHMMKSADFRHYLEAKP